MKITGSIRLHDMKPTDVIDRLFILGFVWTHLRLSDIDFQGRDGWR
jgi:hypothetical protein